VGFQKTVDETFYLSRPRRGAILKEEVWQDEHGTVVRYGLAYLNPRTCGADNGRVLGYDNAHGYHHRHFMGQVEQVGFTTYADLNRRFLKEVQELWRQEDESNH
jgi:hypothetical protein